MNGAYLKKGAAQMPIEDRGLLFGDAVYEVIHFSHDFFVDAAAHFERLDRSLGELSIEKPYASHASLLHKIRYLKRCNQIDEGFVYMQISRGIAPRNHLFPDDPKPSFFMLMKHHPLSPFVSKKIRTERDGRWHRCDIKTTNLLPNVLAKQSAFEKGLFDTWGVTDDGMVTEGALSNAWIVKKGALYTAPKTCNILGGITRMRLIKLATEMKISVAEKSFSCDDLYQADEAFSSSSNNVVVPITHADNKKIGTGKPGPISEKLYAAYLAFVEKGVCLARNS